MIHNEVNTNAWFDIGCGDGVPCNADTWIQTYVDNYAAAYDAIVQHQSEAKVLLSFEHHFDTEYDQPSESFAMISVKTFITEFADRIGDRKWRVAYHPYAPNLLAPEFSPLDLPRVTYGNLGVIVAWLRATFPDKPYTWEVELTESGINSSQPSSSEAAQNQAVCDSLRNVLGTPGITNYIYHRLRDNASEGELQVGLIRQNDTYKPAWGTWAWANHTDGSHPEMSCGFEQLPYTRLTSSVKDQVIDVHWTSSRLPPSGYEVQQAWHLLRDEAPDTTLLYECLDESLLGDYTFLTESIACDGRQNLGPVGYIWNQQVSDSVPLYSCTTTSGWDRFVSTSSSCDGQTLDGLLGYALPAS